MKPKTTQTISRREFLKKLGLGAVVAAAALILSPKTTMAAVTDNLAGGGSDQIYIGPTQPSTNSDYLFWIDATDGVSHYRESVTSPTWNNVASVWS